MRVFAHREYTAAWHDLQAADPAYPPVCADRTGNARTITAQCSLIFTLKDIQNGGTGFSLCFLTHGTRIALIP